MRWTWKQAAGELWRGDAFQGKGYSGAPGHINVTADEGLKNKGPIPRGLWRMTSYIPSHTKLGPYCIRLTPVNHDALGRSAFLIHGDSIKKPGTASEGCIILGNNFRLMLSKFVGKPDDSSLIEVV